MVSALEGWREDYGQVLREIDSAALLRDEEPLQRLSAVYARLLVQRSQFVIVSEDIRARCSAQSAWAEVGRVGAEDRCPASCTSRRRKCRGPGRSRCNAPSGRRHGMRRAREEGEFACG